MKKLLFTLLLLMSCFSLLKASGEPSFKVKVVGKGKPLLLIPGLGCSGEVWNKTVSALEKEYECHVLTLPGFAGQPPISFEEDYLGKVRKEIMDYVEAKKLKEVGLIGHSLGGFLSLQLAAEQPERFGPVLVVDALPFFPAIQMPGVTEATARPIAENMRRSMVQQAESGAEARQRAYLQSMVSGQNELEKILSWNMASDPETMAQAMYELYTTDFREEIANIQKPVVVLGAWIAYKDYGVTKESTQQAFTSQYASCPQVKVRISERGRHFLMYDDPELYFAGLKEVFPY